MLLCKTERHFSAGSLPACGPRLRDFTQGNPGLPGLHAPCWFQRECLSVCVGRVIGSRSIFGTRKKVDHAILALPDIHLRHAFWREVELPFVLQVLPSWGREREGERREARPRQRQLIIRERGPT